MRFDNFLNRTSCIFILVLSAYLCCAQKTDKDFTELFSLSGTWVMETKKGKLMETWQKENDSTLKSKSFLINGGDTILLEQVKLVRRGGKIMYIPEVHDQNNTQPVVFNLVKLENNRYIFENAQHDFPQRIIYNLPKNDTLFAWIEGNNNGGFRKSEYLYQKAGK